jgi:hypothetical protein
MAARDTALLGEILSTQKAILAKLNEMGREKEDEKKAGAPGSPNVPGAPNTQIQNGGGVGGFNEMLAELKSLNETNKEQLTVLKSIDKKIAGGSGTGGGIKVDNTIGEKLESIGGGMVSLAVGMVALVGGLLFTLLLVPAAPFLLISLTVLALSIKVLTSIYEKLGGEEFAQTIVNGKKALFGMATGIGMFTLSIVLSSLALELVSGGQLAVLGLTMVGFAGLFFLLGKGGETIQKGAKAAAWMGIGMASIALGIVSLAIGIRAAGEILTGNGANALVGGLAAIGIVSVSAIVFGIIGLAGNTIREGAMTVGVMGLGLAAFGLGLAVYLTQIAGILGVGGGGIAGGTKISGGFFETVGSMLVGLGVIAVGAVTLALYGTIFALAGQAELGIPEAILMGSISMAAASLSLIVFGFGLDYYLGVVAKHAGVSGEGKEMSITAESFVSGGVVMAGGLGLLLGVGSLFALAGTVSPLIILGAAAIGATGVAILSLGFGINKFMELVPPGSNIGEELETNLVTIRDAMLAFVGQEDINSGGVVGAFKGLLKGAATGGALAFAILNAMMLGPALSSIASGIGSWANLQNIPKIKGYDDKGQPIYDTTQTANVDQALKNITEYLPKIMQPFVDLSNTANLQQEESLLSMMTGINFGTSPFNRGIRAAAGIGETLSSIAQGLSVFSNLTQAPKIIGYDDRGQPIFDKGQTVNMLDATKNLFDILSVDGPGSVIAPFVNLSKEAGLQEGGSWLKMIIGTDFGSSPFERGITISGKIGATLSAIAKGVGVFANLTQAPLITGYDENGQPIFGGTINALDAIGNLGKILGTTGEGSLVAPFIALGQNAALDEPFSLGGYMMKMMYGVSTGESDFDKGLRVALSMGEVVSNFGAGLGQLANLASIPVIKSYDKQGRPVYGEPINGLSAISNLGTIMGQLMQEFAKASKTIGPYGDPESMEAIGPLVSGVLGGIVESLDIFSNPDKLKKIKGYDANGKPIYYEDQFVSVNQVITNMINVITRMVKALADPAIVDALDELDLADDGMEIGPFLTQFIEPIQKLVEVEKTAGNTLNNIGWGIGEGIKYIAIAAKFTQEANIQSSLKDVGKGLGVYAESLGELAEVATDIKEKELDPFKSIYSTLEINVKDPKKRTYLAQFTDEITRLSWTATAFEKFVNSFGKMAKDMKIFAENFKIMDSDAINAFSTWTESIVTLSTANPETFSANVITANKAINAGFGMNDGNTGTMEPSDAVTGNVPAAQKTAAIKDANNPNAAAAPGVAKTEKPGTIDYAKLQQAFQAALEAATVDVKVSSTDAEIIIGNRRK